MDGWKQGFRPFQPSAESVIDCEAISDAAVILCIGTPLLNLVELFPPLRIWMLEGCCSAPGCFVYDDFRIVVLEDAQQASQVGIRSRLPGEVQTTSLLSGLFTLLDWRTHMA